MEDLKDRTRRYALRVIKLYGALPARGVTRVIGGQVLRSGTSVGAHYREKLAALKDESHQLSAILVTLIKKAKR